MGQINLSGSMIGGPPAGGDTFPGSTFSVPLLLRSNPKGFNVATGVLQRQISTAVGVYATLSGVGATDTVTKCDTLYLKSNSGLLVRLTSDDGTGVSVVAVIPVSGVALLEFDSSKYLKLIEVSGSGLIEYFASGQQ
jgi:hypothetical protein